MDLQALYEKSEYVPFLRSRYFVEGAITGACASPEIPLPDTWLPWTLAKEPQAAQQIDTQQVDEIFDALFAYFKAILANMKDGQLTLPNYAEYKGVEQSFELSEYCSGLMLAHQSNEVLWSEAWNLMQTAKPDDAPELARNLKHCLIVFSSFADIQSAICKANERGEPDLQKNLPKIALSLPSILNQYVSIAGSLARFLPNQFESE